MLQLKLASLSPPHPGAGFVSWWNTHPIKACLITLSMQTRGCFGTFWPQFFPLSALSFWQDSRLVSSRTAVTNTCADTAHWLCNKWWKFLSASVFATSQLLDLMSEEWSAVEQPHIPVDVLGAQKLLYLLSHVLINDVTQFPNSIHYHSGWSWTVCGKTNTSWFL